MGQNCCVTPDNNQDDLQMCNQKGGGMTSNRAIHKQYKKKLMDKGILPKVTGLTIK